MKHTGWQTFLIFCFSYLLISSSVLRRPEVLVCDELGFFEVGMRLSGLYAAGLTGKADFADPEWRKEYDNYGSRNPKVGLYILGLLGHITGGIENFNDRVKVCRLQMALFSAACAALLFWLARESGSLFSGLLATALFLIHPVFRSVQVAILPDVPMLFFLLLAYFSLLRIDEQLKRGNYLWSGFVAFGVFSGLAISTRIYAVVILFTLAAVLIFRRKRPYRRMLAAFFVPGLTVLLLFVITNPLLMQDFSGGIREMTVGHLGHWQGSPFSFKPEAVRYLLTYPFLLYRTEPFGIAMGDLPAIHFSHPLLLAGYVLFPAGLMAAISRRKPVPIFFAAFSFLLIGYVILVSGTEWIVPKVFLLPVASFIWLACLVDGLPIRRFIPTGRKKG